MASNDPGGQLGPFQPLKQVFEDQPLTDHGKKWDSLWEKGDLLPWDRGTPNPALVDVLKDRHDLVGSPIGEDGRRRKALVPGAGRGYDVLLLAAIGYDAYGLEISDNALKAARELSQTQFDQYQRDFRQEQGSGKAHFVAGDFFKDDWLAGITSPEHGFDLIYDYTFLCALPPDARPAWSARMTNLLSNKTHSRLICLEFPLFKDPKLGGPPHGLSAEVYTQHLARPGADIAYSDSGYPEKPAKAADKPPSALVRLARWQPERTHQVGQGTDFISIWRHA